MQTVNQKLCSSNPRPKSCMRPIRSWNRLKTGPYCEASRSLSPFPFLRNAFLACLLGPAPGYRPYILSVQGGSRAGRSQTRKRGALLPDICGVAPAYRERARSNAVGSGNAPPFVSSRGSSPGPGAIKNQLPIPPCCRIRLRCRMPPSTTRASSSKLSCLHSQ